jgi:hypothetical protein
MWPTRARWVAVVAKRSIFEMSHAARVSERIVRSAAAVSAGSRGSVMPAGVS